MNHEDMYKKIPLEARLRLVEDMLTIISDIDCTLTAVVIYKQKIWKPDLDVDTWALRLLFERLCWLLEDKNKPTVSSGKPVEYGILLIDSITKKYDAKIRDKILCPFRDGTYYKSNKYLIEDPLFVESKYRHLSQLVDCAAYCIRRKYRTPPRPDEQEIYDRFNRLIEDKFLKDKHGQFLGHGLKFFP